MNDGRGKRSQDFSSWSVVLYGAVLLIIFYFLAAVGGDRLREMIYHRGLIPHVILIASVWAIGILMVKLRRLSTSRRHNEEIFTFIRKNYDRFLAIVKYTGPENAEEIEGKCLACGYKREGKDEQFASPLECPKCGAIYKKVEEFLSRQESEINSFLDQLSESREKRRISLLVRDCFEVTPEFALRRSQILSDLDAQDAANSYRVPQVLAWTVPMLGFLGTVWGIAQSLSSFTGIMGNVDNVSQIKEGLGAITGGLGVAFDTTLLGIFFSIIITGLMAYLQRWENNSLDRFDRISLDLLKTLSIRESQAQPSKTLLDLERYTKALEGVAKQSKITADERKVLELAVQSIAELGEFSHTLSSIADASRDLTKAVKRLDKPKEFRIIQE
jgi:biopolymer transport protein ExbB/TolQ